MELIDKAIYEIYGNHVSIEMHLPNGEFQVSDGNLNSIEIDKDLVNAKVAELQAEAQSKENAKASGNTKLLNLGLTQTEATALTGYKPE